MGLLYGACDVATDEYARRIAFLIDPGGLIAEVHGKVSVKTYPHEQLASIGLSAKL